MRKVLVEIPVLLKGFKYKIFENILSIKLFKPVSHFTYDLQALKKLNIDFHGA